MSDWIQIEIELPDHPKVREMARTLGIDRDAVVGKLVRVWGWVNRQSANGFVPHTVDADIDDLARQQGFANAMVAVEWLTIDVTRHAVVTPLFLNHNGSSKRQRLQSAQRSNRYRSRKRLETQETGHAESSRYTSRNRHASSVTNVTLREEKRREKKTLKAKKDQKPLAQQAGRFEEFWSVYPRKCGKKKAQAAWARLKLDAKADDLIADVRKRIAADPQWLDPQYIPHPTTYINGERWNDAVSARPPPPPSKTMNKLATLQRMKDGHNPQQNIDLEPAAAPRLPQLGGNTRR